VLIDGYNLLRAIQNYSEEMAAITDTILCAVLSEYLRKNRKRAQIIFDGIGPPDKTELFSFRNPKVVFSGPTLEADDIIEQLILNNTAPKRLTVVSSDRRIKDAARKRKAITINSLDFWAGVVKCLERKPKHSPEPREKSLGISKFETELWLKEFGL